MEITAWTPEGKVRHRSTVKNEATADLWLDRKRYDRAQGSLLSLEVDKLTVERFLSLWLESIEDTVARYTFRDYKDKVNLYIVPAYGKMKLKSLTTAHSQALYRSKSKADLSPRSVRYIHTTLSKALSQAEAWDLVRKNVAKHAKPPKPAHEKLDAMALDEARRWTATTKKTWRACWRTVWRKPVRGWKRPARPCAPYASRCFSPGTLSITYITSAQGTPPTKTR